MLSTLILFILIIFFKIPSYINVCGRRDPNLNECVANNVQNLRDKICRGLTEMNLPSIESLNIDKLVLSETANNKIYLNNVQIIGLCDYIVNSVTIDIDKLNFIIDISFNQLSVNGTYDIDIHILVPIVYKAPFYLTSDDVRIKGIIQAELNTYKGKKHIFISELKTYVDIKRYDVQYNLNENEISQLGQIFEGLIGSNQEEFIQRLTPSLEKEVSNWLIQIWNNLSKKYSYDQLFPNRT
ncbi:hypothetical protein ACFW04_007901 [Cataglyphis niger]